MSSFWRNILLGSCAFTSICYAKSDAEATAVKRIHNHLFIKDPASAVKEAKMLLEKHPDSEDLHLAYLKALCQKGDEVEAFEQLKVLFKDLGALTNSDRIVLEWLAWSVINKGEGSQLLVVRLYSLLGAAFTKDAKAVNILLEELRGSNAMLRSLAIKLATQYGDEPLRRELLRLIKEEKVWFVRLEVIQALGALRVQEAKEHLQKVITDPKTLAEEKGVSILALAGMYEKISLEELSCLVQSNRAGLRQLAAEIALHLDFQEGVEMLTPLLYDASPHVRISAMKTLGLLQVGTLQGKPTISFLKKNLEDAHPEVSITAGWLAAVLRNPQGLDVLNKWIEQERVEFKRLAAAAVAVTGPYGAGLAQKKMKEETDLYAKVNLAIGLIGQRKSVDKASEVLFNALAQSNKELWMWSRGEGAFFRSLAPSEERHREGIPQYPQMVDQLVKLDILSILSTVGYPKALEAMKELLKTQAWGINGSAAAALLQEGDEGALDVIRQLLEDPDEKIRVQAALILALLGGDSSAVHVLLAAFPEVDREMKIHILEALGHIGDASAIPFLVGLLKEPFQGLRVVAASVLIQCLYH